MAANFYIRPINMEDGSFVYDVNALCDDEIIRVASPRNQALAEELVFSLNQVVRVFGHLNEVGNSGNLAEKFSDDVLAAVGRALNQIPARQPAS